MNFKHLLLQVMRYSVLLTLPVCVMLHAAVAENALSQIRDLKQIKVSFQFTDQELSTVFETVKARTGFTFAFDNEAEIAQRKITVSVHKANMVDFLLLVSKEARVKFMQINDVINVAPFDNKDLKAKNPRVLFQVQQISGTVTSMEDSSPLPGVNIVEKGTTNGTITDFEGKYSLSISEGAILVFSSVGFSTEEITVDNQAVLNVAMNPDLTQLSEIVVVGYGVQKRSDVTGSVASVPKDRLSNLPVTNLTHAIQGTTAGLNITQESSVPGSTSNMQIRGVNSINANRDPFIVLDGVPFFGSTNDINPNDVESIEVLKDASAVAIYGTRGSNGVILITTKRGKDSEGKPRINYNVYAGVEEIAHVLEPMTPDAYVQKYADYLEQTGVPQTDVLPNASEVENYNDGTTTNWVDAATQPGRIQEHNLSLSGGTSNIDYFVSVGHLSQKGVVKGYEYKRTSIRTNLDAKVTDFLKVGVSAFFADRNTDGGRVNLLNATAMSPYSVPYDENGNLIRYPMAPEELYANPLIGLANDRLDRDRNLTGTGYAEITPGFLKGLKYRINGTYAYRLARGGTYTLLEYDLNGGTANSNHSERLDWVIENIISYSKDFGRHHIDFTGLYSAQKNSYYQFGATSSGFINDALSFYELAAGTSYNNNSESDENSLVSQMGRINYSYDSKYLLTLTARRDGYSNFGASNKYGVFPSMAVGWNLHNENFLNSRDFVTELKLRFSYGKTGNQAVNASNSTTQTLANAVQYPFGGTVETGVLFEDLGNADLHWESTTSSNLALDFGIIQHRVSGTIEVYKSVSRDLLLKRNIPSTTGYQEIWDNLGKMQNKGLELTLKTVNIENDNFGWETNLNFSTYKNEILELYGDGEDDKGNNWFIGQPLRVIYGLKKVGIWQEGEDPSETDPSAKAGFIKFENQLTVDTDGDGIFDASDAQIDQEDRVIIGQRDPKWTGGLTNTIRYRNFNLSIFIQTSQGGLKQNADLRYSDEAHRRNLPKEFGYWTAENQSNHWPSLAAPSNSNNRSYHWAEDWSYVRIKDVRFSYTVPQNVLSRFKISGITIYASGRNLYTFTNWIGWDPEMNYSSRGADGWTNNYPVIRTYTIGLNVSL